MSSKTVRRGVFGGTRGGGVGGVSPGPRRADDCATLASIPLLLLVALVSPSLPPYPRPLYTASNVANLTGQATLGVSKRGPTLEELRW